MDSKLSKKTSNSPKKWQKPRIKNIGNAKKLVAATNVVGGGDVQFSVLNPSP